MNKYNGGASCSSTCTPVDLHLSSCATCLEVPRCSSSPGIPALLFRGASNGLYIDIPAFTANIVWREAKLSPELIKACTQEFTEGVNVIRTSQSNPSLAFCAPPALQVLTLALLVSVVHAVCSDGGGDVEQVLGSNVTFSGLSVLRGQQIILQGVYLLLTRGAAAPEEPGLRRLHAVAVLLSMPVGHMSPSQHTRAFSGLFPVILSLFISSLPLAPA